MDPSRKRRIRLIVALTVAVLLASALVYTSFSASSEAKQPSQLSPAPRPGSPTSSPARWCRGYRRQATAIACSSGSATATARRRCRCATRARCPDPVPRGPRGHRRPCASRATSSWARRTRSSRSARRSSRPSTTADADVLTRRPRLLLIGRADRRLRHRRLAVRRPHRAAAQWVDSGRRAVYALARVLTAAFAILERAFLRSDFSFARGRHALVDRPRRPSTRPPRSGPPRRARCCCGCGCWRCGRASCCSSRAGACARSRPTRPPCCCGFGRLLHGLLVFLRQPVRRRAGARRPRARA